MLDIVVREGAYILFVGLGMWVSCRLAKKENKRAALLTIFLIGMGRYVTLLFHWLFP